MDANERAEKIVVVRFWAKVNKTENCWIWTASTNGQGYGCFRIDGKTRRAHGIAWALANGPVSVGLELDHLCRNPSCVRPSHLEPVTHKVNMLRGKNVATENIKKKVSKCGEPFDHINKYGHRACHNCLRIKDRRRYKLNSEKILERQRRAKHERKSR